MCMSCAASADVLLGGGIVGAASLRVGVRMLRTRGDDATAETPDGPSTAARVQAARSDD